MPPAVLQSRRAIIAYSIGWSEVPDHAERFEHGFVFDLEQVGRDVDGKARRWPAFGGCDQNVDRELQKTAWQNLRNSLRSYFFGALAS